MLTNLCSLSGSYFEVVLPSKKIQYDLSRYRIVIVIGGGKATARMAKGIEQILGDNVNCGIIVVKYGHIEDLKNVKIIEAGHPVPDENSVRAAQEIFKLATSADDKTLVINLISGGGSSLLCLPLKTHFGELTLKEKQETTSILLECGAEIDEINTIRKHISGIKGGRLAQALYPAHTLNLILSDVIGDGLDSIASGLTVADKSSFTNAWKITEKYRIKGKLPKMVRKILLEGVGGRVQETPKTGDKVFQNINNVLVGTNYHAIKAAAKQACKIGYNTTVLSSQIKGEASEIAKFYLGIGMDIRRGKGMLERPACIIGGGETTVTLKGSGSGGRNQEMALSFLNELNRVEQTDVKVYFFSGATDGNDGPTDAAGAFADHNIVSIGASMDISIQKYLDNNDSYNYFRQTGGLFLTGPTNTNVCDIQIMLIV